MKTYPRLLFFIVATVISSLLLSGCNETDDVAVIFTGKQWKLTNIFMDNGKTKPDLAMDYWNSDEAYQQSRDWLNQPGSFVIAFEGFEQNNAINGTYSGRATNREFQGSWNADGESRVFTTNQQPLTDGDVLGTAFINALSTAYKYGGDANNLQIFFREGQVKKYLLFRVNEQ